MWCHLKEGRKKFRIYRCHPVLYCRIILLCILLSSLYYAFYSICLAQYPEVYPLLCILPCSLPCIRLCIILCILPCIRLCIILCVLLCIRLCIIRCLQPCILHCIMLCILITILFFIFYVSYSVFDWPSRRVYPALFATEIWS